MSDSEEEELGIIAWLFDVLLGRTSATEEDVGEPFIGRHEATKSQRTRLKTKLEWPPQLAASFIPALSFAGAEFYGLVLRLLPGPDDVSAALMVCVVDGNAKAIFVPLNHPRGLFVRVDACATALRMPKTSIRYYLILC